MKKTLLILFLLIFSASSFGFQKPHNLNINFSFAKQKIPKDKNSSIKATISVQNISKQNVLIVVDEPMRLSYHVEKRELGLNLWKEYRKYDYKITHLKLLKPSKRMFLKRAVPTSLFTKMLDGKWKLDLSVGYITEKNFGKLGITQNTLESKKSNDRFKIPSDFSPNTFAEIQHWENSNEVEIDLNPANEISFGDKLVQDKIKKETSEIYDSKSKPYFFSTTKSFGEKSTCGTEIIAYQKSLRFNRIISKICTKLGRMTTEFYFGKQKTRFSDKEKLIFVYQVFEFYDEKDKKRCMEKFQRFSKLGKSLLFC